MLIAEGALVHEGADGGIEPESPTNEDTPIPNDLPQLRRSTRTRKPSQRMRESQEQEQETIALPVHWEVLSEPTLLEEEEDWDHMVNPVAYAASADPDTMYMHQVLKQPDRQQFVEVMSKEVNDHVKRKHWETIPWSKIPKGTNALPGV